MTRPVRWSLVSAVSLLWAVGFFAYGIGQAATERGRVRGLAQEPTAVVTPTLAVSPTLTVTPTIAAPLPTWTATAAPTATDAATATDTPTPTPGWQATAEAALATGTELADRVQVWQTASSENRGLAVRCMEGATRCVQARATRDAEATAIGPCRRWNVGQAWVPLALRRR